MSLRRRLTWLLVAFTGFALAATFATIYAVQLHVEGAIAAFQQTMNEASWVDRIRLAAREQHVALREIMSGVGEADALYEARLERLFDELRHVARFGIRSQGRAQTEDLLELAAQLRAEFDDCLRLMQQGEHAAARAKLHDVIEGELLPRLDAALGDVRLALDDSRNRSVDDLVATGTQLLVLALTIGMLGIALAIVCAALAHRWVIAPVRQFQEAAEAFSRGNLAYQVQTRSNDELGALGRAMSQMAEGLARAQAELAVSEAKYRSLFRNLRDAAVICDAQGCVIECHDGDTNLLGRAGREAEGRPVLDAWPHWRKAAVDWEAVFGRVLMQGTYVRMADVTLPACDADQAPAIIDLIAYPVEFGQARHVAVVLRDVGERNRAERALRVSEQRYRLLFERNLAGVYRTTLDGRMLDCNESMATMMGYASREELLARHASDLYCTATDRAAFIACLQEQGVLTNSELRMRKKDGSTIDILENVLLLSDERGVPAVIQGTMVDITERKQAERALRTSEQRHRALADDLRRLTRRMHTIREDERARIARELHDELGQALTVLNMDLYWLRGRSWKQAEATQTRISSMSELVNATIKSIHRICSDLRPAILDDFGLTAAIEWQAREFQSRTGIRCQLTLPEEPVSLPREQVTTVFRMFQESLTNIARHARATEVAVTLGANSGTLSLRVADNGIGITKEQATKPNSVGLAGMRERALRWGGEVEITGIQGKGTTVMLRMPIAQTSVESHYDPSTDRG